MSNVIMKPCSAFLLTSALAVLFADCEGVFLNLAGLRPDLEYLRGYWLKNPREYYRQGRIIFSTKNEIVVTFEVSPRLPCPFNVVDQWTTESLQLKNINHLSSNTSTLLFSSLLYNHGTFYIRENQCDSPQVVEDDKFHLEIPPFTIQNEEKKSIQVLYSDLKTLCDDIEREVSKIDHESKRKLFKTRRKVPERRSGAGLFVNSAESEFVVEYEKGLRYVDVPLVRVLEASGNRGNSSVPMNSSGVLLSPMLELPEHAERHVSFLVSTDYSFIRYDRVTESFYTPEQEVLDDHWFVRSFLGGYVLKDGVKFRTVPSRPRVSFSHMARSTVKTLAPIFRAGAFGLIHALSTMNVSL